ncbi:hypothetical protein J2808_000220 [Pseudarthrobacter sulfonivorans]|nr:hypothetical protein [Pseudarthrobacter sulfonivorans]
MYTCITAHQLRPRPELHRMISDRIFTRQTGGAITRPLLCGIAGAEAL